MKARDFDFVVASDAMRAVLGQLQRVAALDTTVLLEGESGTGKEVAARFLAGGHPDRKRGPVVSVHCGGMPQSLLESELFGHVRGAFTGADRDRVGMFERASGGTLFLDEISTMSRDAQVRLLRVLQERRVTPVGSSESRPVDVRVVVATNRDLRKMVDENAFREDLYYRISTFPVRIPPLRQRPGDVLALIDHFTHGVGERLGLDRAKRFSEAALRTLSAYDWPGNVRQLQNAVEYAMIESQESQEIAVQHLPPDVAVADPGGRSLAAGPVVTPEGLSFRTAVTNLERELILQSLRLSEGNKARAAELLQLKRTTFLEKLRRLDLEETTLGAA